MDVTYNFTPGTRAVAQQVNQNFADVKSAVDPLETAVADIESQLTSGIILPDGSVDFTRLQSYKSVVVNNATNATPIVVTAIAHGFLTGDKVSISGVGGNTAANGVFTITKVGVDTFRLDSSVGNGAYTSGGTCVIYPVADDNLPHKTYVDNGDLKNITQIGTCSTASATTEKAVTLNGFTLVTGATIQVTFTNTNTATAPTLNVNSLGARAIAHEFGDVCSADHPFYVPAGTTVEFTYNGTYWVFKNRVVISYVNGPSWIRVYSDGWIEQGGQYNGTLNFDYLATITFLRPFVLAPCTLSLLGMYSTTEPNTATMLGYLGKTASCFIFKCSSKYAYSTNTNTIDWTACGY